MFEFMGSVLLLFCGLTQQLARSYRFRPVAQGGSFRACGSLSRETRVVLQTSLPSGRSETRLTKGLTPSFFVQPEAL